MEYWLEEEIETAEGPSFKKIKKVKDKEEAIKDKLPNPKKSHLHKCYHDEYKPKPCKREKL